MILNILIWSLVVGLGIALVPFIIMGITYTVGMITWLLCFIFYFFVGVCEGISKKRRRK